MTIVKVFHTYPALTYHRLIGHWDLLIGHASRYEDYR